MNLTEIGIRVRYYRKQKKMTQGYLAQTAGLSLHYVYEIEHGMKMMSLTTLDKILKVLDISADLLLYGKEPTGEA